MALTFDQLAAQVRRKVPPRLVDLLRRGGAPTTDEGDDYEESLPSNQTAVDIFRGEWTSQLPNGLRSGSIPLFADERIAWLGRKMSVKGANVLELGPLEGGHSYMLEHLGANRVVSVEANRRAFLRCLVVKEILGLRGVEFLCGDFVKYVRETEESFDLCIASGVLYHMPDPVELLRLVARVSDRLYLWTHYYDAERIRANPRVAAHFPSAEGPPFRFEYGAVRETQTFCGSGGRFSYWLDRPTIVSLLNDLGFDQLEFAFEEPDHQHGPALAVLAVRG
jgi:SAM-dependent methyltransferase